MEMAAKRRIKKINYGQLGTLKLTLLFLVSHLLSPQQVLPQTKTKFSKTQDLNIKCSVHNTKIAIFVQWL